MAENLLMLKRRIKAAKNIAQVARAMEMVSASKIRRAREALELNKPYAQKITELTFRILAQTEQAEQREYSHPYVTGNESKNTLVLVVSTDKGLCGSLNTNLARTYHEIEAENVLVIALGKKARHFCRGSECSIVAEYDTGTVIPQYSIVYKIIEVINHEFLSGNASSFKILFSEFASMYVQTPSLLPVLPIEAPADAERLPYVFEPKRDEILAELLPYYLEVVLYETILEAFTSEQAARMMAMNNAKTNALEMSDYLTLVYNKSRQEKITNELQVLANYVS
jgi:F-type H+-transporting ATPase subunit gamma